MRPPRPAPSPARRIAVLAVVALAVALPWLAPNPFYVHIGTLACLNLMLVLGLAIIARAGQLSMGHAGFALVGGYTSALLSMQAGWPRSSASSPPGWWRRRSRRCSAGSSSGCAGSISCWSPSPSARSRCWSRST